MKPFSLAEHGLNVTEVHSNLRPQRGLYEHAIRYEKDASIAENGGFVAYSGARRPAARRRTSVSSRIPRRKTTSGGGP